MLNFWKRLSQNYMNSKSDYVMRSSKSFNEGMEATTHESVVGDLDENITTTEETVDLFK